MGDITVTGATIIAAVSALFVTINTAIIYLYKANERITNERILSIEKSCVNTINIITDDRNFWRDAWASSRPQIAQRDKLLQAVSNNHNHNHNRR